MSSALPIGEVANEAVRFGLLRWHTVVRYALAPGAIAIGLSWAIGYLLFDMAALSALNHPGGPTLDQLTAALKAPVPVAIIATLFAIVVIGFLFAGVAASIFRLVALGEDRPGIVHLRIDGPAMRVFTSYIILLALGLLVLGVSALLAQAATGQPIGTAVAALRRLMDFTASAAPGAAPPPALLASVAETIRPLIVAGLIAFPLSLYLNVKLSPMPAGSAVENRLIPIKALRMTTGHAWSIFASIVLFSAFALVASIIVELAMSILQLVARALSNLGSAAALAGGVLSILISVFAIVFAAIVNGAQGALYAIIYRRLEHGA